MRVHQLLLLRVSLLRLLHDMVFCELTEFRSHIQIAAPFCDVNEKVIFGILVIAFGKSLHTSWLNVQECLDVFRQFDVRYQIVC